MDIQSRLALLPARPPTPPRDTSSKLHSDINLPPLQASETRVQLDTPVDSPNSADYFSKSSDRASKRVDFLPDAQTIDQSIRRLLKSSDAARAPKSILKYSSNLPSSDPVEPDFSIPECHDLAAMLEHTLRALANPDLSHRFDAYMSLNGCLKAYSDTPSQEQLVAQCPALVTCIRRDVEPQEDVRSTMVISEALKLASTLMWLPSTIPVLPSDFRPFIAGKAIASIASPSISKALANQYLHLLTMFEFGPKNVSNEKVDRMISALKDIETRVSGRRVLFLRLTIYQRLVQQEHPVMTSRFGDWVHHLFNGLQSEQKEICDRATMLGLAAGTTYGTQDPVSRYVAKLLSARQSDQEDAKSYLELFAEKLASWTSTEEHALQVPHIWSIPLMFLRSPSRQLHRWDRFQLWVSVFSKCLNSRNMEARATANREWSRFIYCLQPHLQNTEKIVNLLIRPIESQLKRRDALAKPVLSAYWTLMYHSFRPGQPEQVLNRCWRECVDGLIASPLRTSMLDVESICRMLQALFGDRIRPTWDQEKGNGTLVKPEELPRAEPRWIRSQCDQVIRVIEIVILSDTWTAVKGGEAKVMKVWTSFCQAIRDAASREIKISAETMKAIATITTRLKAVVLKSLQSDLTSDHCDGLKRFRTLLLTAVNVIGPLPFSEHRLTITSSSALQVADTPSRMNGKATLCCSVDHLLSFMVKSFETRSFEKDFENAVTTLVETAMPPNSSRRSKLKQLREFVQHTLPEGDNRSRPQQALWDLLVQSVITAVRGPATGGSKGDQSEHSEDAFRDAVKILELEIPFVHAGSQKPWIALLDAVAAAMSQLLGPHGLWVSLVQPLVEAFQQRASLEHDLSVDQCFAALFKHLQWPQLADNRKFSSALGLPAVKKSSYLDHFASLCDRAALVSQHLYQSPDVPDVSISLRFLIALQNAIRSCPAPDRQILLRFQSTFCIWVSDPDTRLSTVNDLAISLFKAVSAYSCELFPLMRR